MEDFDIAGLYKRAESLQEEIDERSRQYADDLDKVLSPEIRQRFYEIMGDGVVVLEKLDLDEAHSEDRESWGKPAFDGGEEEHMSCLNSFECDLGFDAISGYTKQGTIDWFQTKFRGGISEVYTMLEVLIESLKGYEAER